MAPYDLSNVQSLKPARYAIELNAGIASGLGIKPGDRIEIPADVAHTSR
jgi:uncharacterized membrane protein (UPF0127 family)